MGCRLKIVLLLPVAIDFLKEVSPDSDRILNIGNGSLLDFFIVESGLLVSGRIVPGRGW